jgi:hypothetical protein
MSSYQGWSQIKPPKKARKPKPKAKKPKAIVRPFPGYMTPAEIRKAAMDTAQAQLDPLRGDIRNQATQAQARTDAQGKAILAAAQAAAELLKGMGPQVSGIYQQAAANQAQIGKGYSGGLQQAQDASAAQTNAQLANIGAPEGQMQHPGGEAANVLYGLGGAIPASTLSTQGAAFGAAAAQLPATAVLRGQQDFGANVAKGAQEQVGFEQMLRDLDGKYPGMLDSLISGMNRDQLQLFSLNLQSQYLGLNTKKAEDTNVNKAADRKLKVALARLAALQAAGRITETERHNRAVEATARAKAATAARKAAGKKALTPAQRQKIQATAETMAEDFYYGQSPKQHFVASTGEYTDVPGTGKLQTPYGQALNRMIAAGIPRAYAIKALNTFYRPGEAGRPGGAPPPKPQSPGSYVLATVGAVPKKKKKKR